MRKLILVPIIFLSLFLIQSCATSKHVAPAAPVVHIIEKERIINKPFDAVWQSIIELLATYNMPIKNLDKSSGFISTDYKLVTGEVSQYMICGGASSTFSGKVELTNHGGNLNVLVKKINEESTKVTVNTFYSCTANKYRYASLISTTYVLESSTKIDCTSSGILEKAIFDYISSK
jgi:uncharacterized lipoprotein